MVSVCCGMVIVYVCMFVRCNIILVGIGVLSFLLVVCGVWCVDVVGWFVLMSCNVVVLWMWFGVV